MPQITPGERKSPRKKDAGPRAVAVLQLAANGKASLVPIAILVDGKFWDASAYKADPIPMALEPGTVYEAERAGSSLGLFTVSSALHSNAVNVQTPWLGTGTWIPEGSEKPKSALTAEKQPIGIDPTDEPPRLTRSGSQPATQPANTTPTTPQTTSGGVAGSGQTSQGQTSQGQTNPGKTGSQTTSKKGSEPNSTAPNAPAPQSNPKSGDAKSSDTKATEANVSSGPSIATSDSGADEESRPRLRRGKPAAPFADDDIPGYSKPGATATPATVVKNGAPATPDKAAVQLIPAISDATVALPKSFAFEWLKDEEGERLKQMTKLATEQVRAYIEAQAKATMVPPAKPKTAGAQARRRSASAKTMTAKIKDPILENAQMKAFDLWGNNNPVMIFTAEAHMPPPPAGTPHADSDLQYSILLVANPDIYNNLHKLFVSVTDKYHLDMTPRLELVDAVDADGDGRGELLFREASDNASGWRIYRATADKLWKMFDSLNP
ncbi:MAG TPA: hypothetical protein VH350_14355 [Candidatus Sulfotelmatobacter sp.]|nr:hypothetical protein [Candidatus Sulfotelmatobacter sp.]